MVIIGEQINNTKYYDDFWSLRHLELKIENLPSVGDFKVETVDETTGPKSETN